MTRSDMALSITGEEPGRLNPTLSCLKELLELPEGWDSYGGSVITDEAILGALDVLERLQLPIEAPQPAVVPGSSGSVQLEWHRSGADVEIHISSEGHATAFFSHSGEYVEFDSFDQEAKLRLSGVLSPMAS